MSICHEWNFDGLPLERLLRGLIAMVSASLVGIVALAMATGMQLLALVGIGALLSFLVVWLVNDNGHVSRAACAFVGLSWAVGSLGVWAFGWEAGAWTYWLVAAPLVILRTQSASSHRARAALSVLVLSAFSASVAAQLLEVGSDFVQALSVVHGVFALGAVSWTFHVMSECFSLRHREVSSIAYEDALTELPNRRVLEELFSGLHENAELDSQVVAVIDVDHFKQLNDRFGHACGDEVLKRVAEVMGKCLRQSDLLVRWGGEEFVAVLPDIKGAKRALERIRSAVDEHAFVCDGRSHHVTVTIGAACLNEFQSTVQALEQADAALYRGKANGRNRVVWSTNTVELRPVEAALV